MNCFKSLYKNRYVLHELVRKSVKTQYRNSALGMLWTILNPLLNMLVMMLVFSKIFGRDALYPVYLLTGNILFSCLRSATDGALSSVVNNRGLLTRIKIDSYLFPLSSVLSSLITFLFSFIALLVIMLYFQITGIQVYSLNIFAVILMIPAFMLFEYGIGLFLSAIYVYARDIKHLYNVFLTLWTYMTPIFYHEDMLSGSFAAKILKLNPMTYFLRFFRDIMYRGISSTTWSDLGIIYICAGISVVLGTIMFKGLKKKFMTNL